MEVFLVYLWSIWDNFEWVGVFLFIGFIVLLIILPFIYFESDYGLSYAAAEDKYEVKRFKKLWSFFKKYSAVIFTYFFITSFIPNKNQMVLIVSAPYIMKVVKDSNATQIPTKLVKVLNTSLDYLNKQMTKKGSK